MPSDVWPCWRKSPNRSIWEIADHYSNPRLSMDKPHCWGCKYATSSGIEDVTNQHQDSACRQARKSAGLDSGPTTDGGGGIVYPFPQ